MNWLSGEFPLSIETVQQMVLDRCDPPDGYDVSTYEFFKARRRGFCTTEIPLTSEAE